jgi:hypothetical protein
MVHPAGMIDSALELVFLLINIIPIDNGFEGLVERPCFS